MSRTKTYATAIACIALVVCSGLYILHGYIKRSRAQTCQIHLVGVAQGLMFYCRAHGGYLPPPYIQGGDGAPAHSWRALVLPYLSYEHEYKGYRFSESWDSPHNTQFMNWMTTYACPIHSESPEMTNYVAVVGEGTLWPQPKEQSTYEFRLIGEGTRWPAAKGQELPSTCNGRILLVELVQSDIPWTEPRDITLESLVNLIQNDPTGKLFNRYVKGVLAIDASGHIRIIDPSEDIDQIKAMFICERNGFGNRNRDGAE